MALLIIELTAGLFWGSHPPDSPTMSQAPSHYTDQNSRLPHIS